MRKGKDTEFTAVEADPKTFEDIDEQLVSMGIIYKTGSGLTKFSPAEGKIPKGSKLVSLCGVFQDSNTQSYHKIVQWKEKGRGNYSWEFKFDSDTEVALMNKNDQIVNNEKSRVQIGGSNAEPKGGNDKTSRPGQSPLPSRPGQSPLPRTDVSGNTGVPLGGETLGKNKVPTRVTGNGAGANDKSRRGLNLVGAGERKTGPKAPGQTGTNFADKNTKGQTQTGKPGNLDYQIPCQEDATSDSNNFVSVKTKTDNTSADINTDRSNIQNHKPGQLKNFLNLVGRIPNPNDEKNPRNPNAANQTGAPNANANAKPLLNVDAKKPDQSKRPTSTQPKAAKPKPDMRSRISNIRNANKFSQAEDSSLSPIANLISERTSKSPAKTPDRPSKS
jgi:hypothetical protein